MDFWRIYRLLRARRGLILAIVLIAGVVILGGATFQAQRQEYTAEALMQPEDPTLPEVTSQNATPATVNLNEQRTNSISDLLILLRTSNDLYLKMATLMRLNEEERGKEVERILVKNGYFAQTDSDIESQAAQLIKQGSLSAKEEKKWIADQRKAVRDLTVNNLAKAKDDNGAFAASGVTLSEDQIITFIRKEMEFESVDGPFSTEDNRQVVNQLRIVCHSARPAEAELYANIMAVAFLDYYTNRSASAVNARIALLNDKLERVKSRYNTARNAIVRYKESNKTVAPLVASQSAALAQSQNYENALSVAQQDLAASTASVARLKELLAQAPIVRTVPFPADENPQVRDLQSRLDLARLNLNKIKNADFYDINSQVYKDAQAELDAAEKSYSDAKGRVFGATTPNGNRIELEGQLSLALLRSGEAQKRVEELTKQLAAQRAILAKLPATTARLIDLEREASISEDNVRALERSLAAQELFAIEKGRAGTVNIVSQARADVIEPLTLGQRVKIMLYGMVLALVFGVTLVIVLDSLDNSIREPEDAEGTIGLPVLGVLPAQLPDPLRAARVTELEPFSPASEAYRLLRNELIFASAASKFQTLMIAGAKPGQGATTTAANVAIALAQAGERVILVDADLRQPRLHTIFDVDGKIGLAQILRQEFDLSSGLADTSVENLRLLPAGPPASNPSELLLSRRLAALLDELRPLADFIIFDVPAVIAFADASALASRTDATLLVIKANEVSRGAERHARTLLEKAKANILGIVLNGVEASKVDSVHFHQKYYGLTDGSGHGGNGVGGPARLPAPEGKPSVPALPGKGGSAQTRIIDFAVSCLLAVGAGVGMGWFTILLSRAGE